MASKTVTIQVHNDDGDMTVTPSLIHLREQDTLTWQLHGSHNGKITLTFRDGDAFGAVGLGGNARSIAPTAARKKGTYHYHVAVDVDPGGQVKGGRYEDNHCPTVIIR